MFLALAGIATHLRNVPHFQSWSVRDGLTSEPRDAVPFVDVRFEGATVGDAKGASSVNVSPVVSVSIGVARSPDAAADLHAAFAAAIKALHGFKVPGANETKDLWTALILGQVRALDPFDSVVGCQLIFTLGKRFEVGACGAC
ncbi:hypothetical protein [Acidovorax sp. Leaf78]|uniref:hypothetical protein n=1 Tax=Acidovorax sp. Leaf78 TaxID=1736237 RepID=UPI0007005EA1|nr:hypothetical protein [Acidovorax sp. Leaf78]KQO23492.1 hypothetical protein ASF16_04840 [Acidovorax sp. Leaf78]